MKISLNWIFDHIKGELSHVNIANLVDTFIRTTAEIECWKKVNINAEELTLAKVININNNDVIVFSDEYKKEYILPKRSDISINSWVMINTANISWATSTLLGGAKEMLLPAISCPENLRDGTWKSTIEKEDYIIDIDNKSINSRPDLWGHRGLAREIAAILNLPLKSWQECINEKFSCSTSAMNSFNVSITCPQVCNRFALFHLPSVTVQASDLNMIIRLSRLDSRAINFIVDATNYVMLDMGQPMHAFDADTIQTKSIAVSYAQDKEKLGLIDGETIELTSRDLVITDNDKAISLAGIMGGSATAITSQTKSVLLEAAHFDPVVIRRSASWYKKRTESSIRFDKNIDPMGNVEAIKRFLFLLDKAGVAYEASGSILSLGEELEQKMVLVKHTFIEQRLGILLKPEKVIDILSKLEFTVEQLINNSGIAYSITIPSFRATKDIKIPEDIVEEVGRYIGYDTLPRVMPSLQLRPHDLHKTYTTRTIKRFLSYGLQMKELYGYSFFDESVLRQLAWQPREYIEIKNPISENYTRLLTTLQPHLLKAIGDNSIIHTQLRFYEWARVWRMDGENMVEQKSLSGVFFDSTKRVENKIDFYVGKNFLSRLFDTLHINISWQTSNDHHFSWFSTHETAILMHEGRHIGIAGMVTQETVNTFSPAEGSVFMFEVNADYILDYKKPLVRFNSLSKYPSVRRDISIIILASVTTDTLIDVIKKIDQRITQVILIDFFSKPEWKDKKALTFQVEIQDKEKTLTSEVIEVVWNQVIAELKQYGAEIR